MRKAFTMIEIIFVIVIIGLLAAVAIPKLAATRNDATSSVCTYEVGQLITEIGNAYLGKGYNEFKDLTIVDMSNIKTNVGLSDNGIFEPSTTKVDITGVTYYCDGEALMKLVANLDGSDYNLTVQDQSPVKPAALKAALKLRKIHQISAGGTRLYRL